MPEAAGPWRGPHLFETLFHVPNLRHITVVRERERESSSKVNTAAEGPGKFLHLPESVSASVRQGLSRSSPRPSSL